MIYRSKQGETLDIILWRYYQAYPLDEILKINPGIAGIGKILPEGTLINLPDIKVSNEKPVIRLWS